MVFSRSIPRPSSFLILQVAALHCSVLLLRRKTPLSDSQFAAYSRFVYRRWTSFELYTQNRCSATTVNSIRQADTKASR